MHRVIFQPEHHDFRESVRGFLQAEAVPRTQEWEAAGVIDRDFWRKAAAQGFVAFQAPEELGGAGIDDFRFNAILDEEAAYTGAATDGFALVNDIVTPYLLDLTTEEQRARWLPDVTTGDCVPVIAMSEPGTGSDLRAIATKATWRDDHWSLSGSKTFVTSGIQADLVICAAQIVKVGVSGMGLFAVRADAPGFTRGRKLEKIGRRGQDTAELFFDDVAVAEEDLIGEPGRGLQLLMKNLPQERLSIAVTAVASAERALQITLDYVRTRNAFGRPVGSFQANRFALADAHTRMAAARTYVDRCIGAAVDGTLTAEEAAGVKFWTTELQWEVMDLSLQMHGGYGYMEEYEIARMWRDARVQRIYGGTTEIMKEIVGRSLGL
jgi:alkylation response protein AidB-like acyl-CoA dehydrogenase